LSEDANDPRRETLGRLGRSGITPWTIAADVSDIDAVRDAIEQIIQRYGRLDGVVHAAGVLNDSMLWRKQPQDVHDVLAPKVYGAWALHMATREIPLDFFVLCSSMSSLMGGAGHATYAAANAFLDSLAHFRRRHKLPAISMNWGVWGETTAGSIPRYQQAMRASGIEPLTNREALAAFDRVLQLNPAQIGVIRFTQSPDAEEAGKQLELVIDAAREVVCREKSALLAKLEPMRGLDRAFDNLAATYVATWLDQLGINRPGEVYKLADLRQASRLDARFEAALPRLLNMLVEDEAIEYDTSSERITIRRSLSEIVATLAEQELQARRRFPNASAQLDLLIRCGGVLGEILSGQRNAIEVLFAEGNYDDAEALYEQSPWPRLMAAIAAGAVRCFAQSHSGERPLRVLEIGAGTGATTSLVLPEVEALGGEYVFTDVSQAFVDRARTKFSAQARVEFARLDIEYDLASQGFRLGDFDMVIAANVLHATRRLDETLAHVRDLLRAGGMLLLIEATEQVRFGDLTFGLTEGWWRHCGARWSCYGF